MLSEANGKYSQPTRFNYRKTELEILEFLKDNVFLKPSLAGNAETIYQSKLFLQTRMSELFLYLNEG
jgi:hypothetical protein